MTTRCFEVDGFSTVYIGGGTPSSLSLDAVAEIASFLPLDSITEFTVEMNPEDVSDDTCRAWRDAGANRVSMGVQSLNDAELAAVGRRHTAATAINAYNILRKYFDNVSLDIILALPGQTIESLRYSLNSLLDLHPDHFSAYMLCFEPRTRLYAQRLAGKIIEADEDTQASMYNHLCEMAATRGYDHYEISNFAMPGRRARHNAAYWADIPYLGLGPAAHSFDGTVRRENPRDFNLWFNRIEASGTAFTVEEESAANRVNDRIMVALRTSQGLDLDCLPPLFRRQVEKNLHQLAPGRIVRCGSLISIPEKAWIVSDDTIATLFVE